MARGKRARTLGRMLLWSSVDLDTRGLAQDTLGIAAGVAFASGLAIFYLIGESWHAMRMVEIATIVAGLAVGVSGTFDVLSRRPSQLAVPLAHVFGIVLALVIALRLAGHAPAARAALAWSLGLHLCLLPLTTRLWAIVFGERSSTRDVARRRHLLSQAESGEDETLLVRVLDSTPGYTEVSLIGSQGGGVARIVTSALVPRPRRGLVYALTEAVVINRSAPASEHQGEWARYIVRFGESAMLGDRSEVTEPAESAQLARRALFVLIAVSAGLSTLSAIAAL